MKRRFSCFSTTFYDNSYWKEIQNNIGTPLNKIKIKTREKERLRSVSTQ